MVEEISNVEAAKRMRELSDDDRDAMISGSDNVIDSRDVFENKRKQIEIAKSYAKPKTPPTGGVA